MRFKVDENLPLEAADILREAGHDVSTVLGQGMGGCPDNEIASACVVEGRALLTLDLDFADRRTYPSEDFAGLVVLRLNRQDKLHVLEAIGRLLPLFTREPVIGRLWVVEEDRVRIRGGAVR
jgi:predicted nuclease of predicted toxin-antitoxin system